MTSLPLVFWILKLGDFSLFGSENGRHDSKKMVKTYYKLPESGVSMAAKIQRILVSCGGKNSAIATYYSLQYVVNSYLD